MHAPTDPTDATDLTVSVNGDEDTYRATADVDADGTNDSVYVETDDGGYVYTDTDGDGIADTLTEFDTDGGVSAQAVFDDRSGAWHPVTPGSVDITRSAHTGGAGLLPAEASPTEGGAGQPITIETPDGPAAAGPATYDTDGDGAADTAVAGTTDGGTLVVTDTDGDGSADVRTEVATDGDFTSYEHTGDGEWAVVDSGNLADGARSPQAPAITDPATGEWVRG